MKKVYPKNRRIKKALRHLEAELGGLLFNPNYDYESLENKCKFDIWVSYYVTWVIKKHDFQKDVWCDGIWWENGAYKFTISKVSQYQFEIVCDLDILRDSEQCRGTMLGNFEFSSSFVKFQCYKFSMSIFGKQFYFESSP